jgi:hypothetical protein
MDTNKSQSTPILAEPSQGPWVFISGNSEDPNELELIVHPDSTSDQAGQSILHHLADWPVDEADKNVLQAYRDMLDALRALVKAEERDLYLGHEWKLAKGALARAEGRSLESYLGSSDDPNDNRFPNGFANWKETYFEIVAAITLDMESGRATDGVCAERAASQGRGGLWELAEELTKKFEVLHKGRIWDGEYYDALDSFLTEELGPVSKQQ